MRGQRQVLLREVGGGSWQAGLWLYGARLVGCHPCLPSLRTLNIIFGMSRMKSDSAQLRLRPVLEAGVVDKPPSQPLGPFRVAKRLTAKDQPALHVPT